MPVVSEQEKPAEQPVSKKSASPAVKRGRGRPAGEQQEAEAAILGQLKANGGTMPAGSARKLGRMLAVRKSTAHSALLGLIAAGIVVKAGGALVLRTLA